MQTEFQTSQSLGKKVIVVVGATGAQGGSLVRAILNEGDKTEFSVRAIVRNPQSEKAEWLRKWGAEVVQADVNDEDSMVAATEGAYGMFCVSFFWERQNPEDELRQARIMATAAKKNRLQHVVWSTLEDTRTSLLEGTRVPTLMNRYKVPPYDAKGEADRFFADFEIPTTYLLTSFYWDNMIYHGFEPKKTPDGKYALTLPLGNKRLVGMASEDIGKCALGIFKHPFHFINRRVGIMGEALTGNEMAEKMSRAFSKEIICKDVSPDEFAQQKLLGARIWANMFAFYQDCEEQILHRRNIAEAHKLNPEMMSFDQWLNKYRDYIPLGA